MYLIKFPLGKTLVVWYRTDLLHKEKFQPYFSLKRFQNALAEVDNVIFILKFDMQSKFGFNLLREFCLSL